MLGRRARGARRSTRAVIPALFAIAAGATGIHAAGELEHALSQPTARAWLLVAYALLRTGVTVAFAVFTVGRSVPRSRSRSPVAILACATAIAAVLAFEVPHSSTPEGVLLAGELIAVVSCAWLLTSVCFLGRCFGVLPEARGLVTRGPYGIVRHPVYLGEIGACAGLAIAAPSLIDAAILSAFIVAQAVRMRLEERAVAAAFPEYEAYALRTPRLFPRWRATRSAPFGSVRSPGDGVVAGEATSAIVSRATSRA
jgi:protein-S-isoprenylcysteine O-methyltransferase Ste14